MSVRADQSYLTRIKGVTRFLEYIFKHDAGFLKGEVDKLPLLKLPD
jgi:hypothetical protein